jgi:hypothetical protein
MARVQLQLHYDFGGELSMVKREIVRIGRIRRLLTTLGYKAHEGRSHNEEGVFLTWQLDSPDLVSVLSSLAEANLGPFRGGSPSLIVYGNLDPMMKAQVEQLGFNSFPS